MKARHFQALPLASSVLSRELRRKGPVCCELRGVLATSETCRVQYDSQYCQHSAMVGLTLGVSTALYPTVAGGVHAPGPHQPLSDGPRSLNASTSSPETHLELHNRLAHHREQPRRQRDQLRRELRVRHTGGDRRRRLPVPREQHRHEQLEPLHPHRSSVIQPHTRLNLQENEGKARSADSSAFLAAWCPVAVYPKSECNTAMSTPQVPVE
jgi:hypothetical protein